MYAHARVCVCVCVRACVCVCAYACACIVNAEGRSKRPYSLQSKKCWKCTEMVTLHLDGEVH